MVGLNQINKEEAFKALASPDTFATVLLALAIIASEGDPDLNVFEMDNLAVDILLEDTFENSLHQECKDKLHALLTAITSEEFFIDPETFTRVCGTLVDGDPGFFDDDGAPSSVEVIWSIYEVRLNMDYQPKFSNAVIDMIKTFLDVDRQSELKENDVYEESIQELYKEMENQLIKLGFKTIPKPPSFDLIL